MGENIDKEDRISGRETSRTQEDRPSTCQADPLSAPADESTRNEDLQFKQRLTALVDLSNELSRTHTMDDLCRLAVELGRSKLGFDRVGIWLISENQDAYLGTFGTDEHGNIRDERNERHPLDTRALEFLAYPRAAVTMNRDFELTGLQRDTVGYGHHASSTMVHEGRVFGFVDIDNLLTHRPLTERDGELLGLFGSTLAQSCTRVKAEEALRASNETERRFKDRLTKLLKVSNELSKIGTWDELCRRAIELGREQLEFERLGMWFFSEDRKHMIGSFGTDEQGNLRDERGLRISVDAESRERIAHRRPTEAIRSADNPLTDAYGRFLARGPHAYANIWDGETVSGGLFLDHLLTGRPIDDQECELLVLYASVLGHLCSRIWAEETHLAQVRKLSADAEKSLETERARISKELHDELGQILTALNMNLAWVAGRLSDAPEALLERVIECKSNVNQVVRTVRDLSRSLRPQLLDHQGLADAIRSHISEFEQSAGIACRMVCAPPDLEVADPPATTVFRIVQEALTNVARHSGASECEIILKQEGDRLCLTIQDNGRGADPEDLSGGKSLGIIGMKERAASVNGKVTITNSPAGGVLVMAWIPVHMHE